MRKNSQEGKERRNEEKEAVCALVFYLYDPVFLDVSVACSDKGVAGSQAHHQARFITRMIIDVFYTLRQYFFVYYTHTYYCQYYVFSFFLHITYSYVNVTFFYYCY